MKDLVKCGIKDGGKAMIEDLKMLTSTVFLLSLFGLAIISLIAVLCSPIVLIIYLVMEIMR